MKSQFGVYVHIPFCIQRCFYCDFATYAKDQISANDNYIETLCTEISKRSLLFDTQKLNTIYFGGGTPSLLLPSQINKILETIKRQKFHWATDIEITMEVNPATMDEEKLIAFKNAGINRVSIGCQTFDDQALKDCNREHKSNDTVETIELVKSHLDNYSLDLLFSLPKQGLAKLQKDVEKILSFAPPHVSAYCLTIPEKHPMNKDRCPESEQLKMFDHIHTKFSEANLLPYEISNFAKEGYQSCHNNLYWTDETYWGVGLSAHSYKKKPDWGYRFWNPSTYDSYLKHIETLNITQDLEFSFPARQREKLTIYESLTDYCHTHLRLTKGLDFDSMRHKFGDTIAVKAVQRINTLLERGLLDSDGKSATLTRQGLFLSNQVFAELLFSQADIDKI